MKSKMLLWYALLFSAMLYSQETLTLFQFNNNLNPDVPYAGTLTYHNSAGSVKAPTYDANMLKTTAEGDYLEMSYDTTSKQNLILSFYGDFAAWFLTGYWKVSVNTGVGGTYVDVGQQELYSILNIPFGGDFSLNLPTTAENKSDLKIRIRSDFGFLPGTIRLDNLKLVAGSPKIKVYSTGNVYIPHLSPATTLLTTDFGTRQTTDAAASRIFRVRNFQGSSGSVLNVSSITVTGVNSGDFTVTPNSLTGIGFSSSDTGSPNQTFTISFLPLADGLRTAEISLYSNSAPSPYKFTVVGTGASCTLVSGDFAINTMTTGTQTLEANYTVGDLIGGGACSPAPAIGRLYPSTNNFFSTTCSVSNSPKLYISSSQSLYARGSLKEVEFGGTNGLNLFGQKDVSIAFNIAAFATGSASNGVNAQSYITLSVQKPDNSWSDEMTLYGSEANGTYYPYAFGAAYSFEQSYDGNGSAITNNNRNENFGFTQIRYGTMKLNLPANSGIQNLKFKIKAYTPNSTALWLIDDVRVITSNSEYRIYRNDGQWANSLNVVVAAPSEATKTYKNYKAIFAGNYTVPIEGLTVCECEVNNGTTLGIPQNRLMTVRGNIINNGIGNNFVVKSDANLIQLESAATNTGKITVERNVANMDNIPTKMDYVYWSSPVVNQNLQTFSPGTPPANFLQYKEATDYFVTTYDGVFKPAKGYAIRAETTGVTSPSYGKDYLFTGIPNNGDYSIPITRSSNTGAVIHGYNLIGNPYPSNIDFDQLYSANNSLIYNTVWFWKNNSFTSTQQGSGYTGNNYVIYNGVGGNDPGVNGIIKVGQGFLVQNKGAENSSAILNFKNSYGAGQDLRVATAGTFYQKNSVVKNRFWLKLIAPGDVSNYQLIGYVEGATDDFEIDYDAEAFGLSSNLFYSMLNDKRLVIQGKSAQFSQSDHVVLGANFFKNQSYTIAIEQPEGIFASSQNVYLKDKQTGILTNLNQGSYTFTANAGENTGRFEIIYKPETVLVTDNTVIEQVIVYRDQNNFVIKSPKVIAAVEVYDMSGKLFTVLKPNSKQATLDASSLMHGIYVLLIKASDGDVTNKKIVR